MLTAGASQIAAVLGHELRNPLSAALTGILVAIEMTERGDPRQPVLERAVVDLKRVASLLSSYLEFQAGRRAGDEAIELSAMLRDLAASRPWHVRASAQQQVVVRGNPHLLQRAMENLIENALRAGAKQVSLSLAVVESAAIVHVEDDGPGVAQVIRDRIFEPGVSGNGSSGLGLAIAREVVHNMDGELELASSERGARFCIRLPVVS